MSEQQVRGSGLERLVADYLDSCRARGLSPKTVERAYGLPLTTLFLPWCSDTGIVAVDEITRPVLDRFSTKLLTEGARSGRKLSPYSVAAYLRPVNQFLNWAREQGHEVKGSAQMPRRRKREIRVLSKEEVQRLEDSAGHERDRLLIRLMFETGAREGEVIAMTVEDLTSRERRFYVRLRGKTGERSAAISAALYGRLRAYREHGRGRDAIGERLWMARVRRPGGRREALTENGLYQAVKEAAAKAGFEHRIYPHLLRHSAITDMIQRRVSPFVIADNCGVSLKVIQDHYSHLGLDARWDALSATPFK